MQSETSRVDSDRVQSERASHDQQVRDVHDDRDDGALGVGGRIKHSPADFVVEEIPAYEPSGDGEHLFLWIEKEGVSADQLIRQIARAFQIPSSTIGCAGMKDTHAVTRQYISVPASVEPLLSHVASSLLPHIRILRAARHTNKLKTGHLHGNRFVLRIRDLVAVDPAELQQRIDRLVTQIHRFGVPNIYGSQRFGRDGATLQAGLAMLRGEPIPKGSIPTGGDRGGFMRRLALSSVQSALFNAYLTQRARDGLLHRALPGDVFQVTESGGIFTVPETEPDLTLQQRYTDHHIIPTGPMFGPKMRLPWGEAAQREEQVLQDAGLTRDMFAQFGKLMQGTRRPLVMLVEDLQATLTVDAQDNAAPVLTLAFTLDRGCYATVVTDVFTSSERESSLGMA